MPLLVLLIAVPALLFVTVIWWGAIASTERDQRRAAASGHDETAPHPQG